MITEQDLQEAIAECEGQRNPTANTCLKLAALYTIQDKMYPKENIRRMDVEVPLPAQSYSYASEPVEEKTEFMQAVIGTDAGEFLSVMDELMTTLKAMVPRLYDGVMRRLSE